MPLATSKAIFEEAGMHNINRMTRFKLLKRMLVSENL